MTLFSNIETASSSSSSSSSNTNNQSSCIVVVVAVKTVVYSRRKAGSGSGSKSSRSGCSGRIGDGALAVAQDLWQRQALANSTLNPKS